MPRRLTTPLTRERNMSEDRQRGNTRHLVNDCLKEISVRKDSQHSPSILAADTRRMV
jgi:hypothetical protein